MAPLRRVLWFVSCFAAAGCFGGPTSDWPADSEDDDEQPQGGPDAGVVGGARDAGFAMDAGKNTLDAETIDPHACGPDAGLPDAQVVEGGGPDAEAADAMPDLVDGGPDAEAADGGVSDAEPPDGGADAGTGCE